MSIFDKFKSGKDATNVEAATKNVTAIASDKAVELIKELSGGKINHSKKVVDNLIVITSASGGAGASTIVANVAYQASKMGLRVLVIDLNILLPAQQIYSNVEQKLSKPDLVEYLLGKVSLGTAIEQAKFNNLLYANNRGLMDLINCESDTALSNFKLAIENLRNLYDLIIIDCPMKPENSLCNTAMYIANQIYLVWDEGISSIANTDKIRRNLADSGVDSYTKVKIILNKRTNIHYSEYPFKKLNIELIQYIPFEPDIALASLNSQIFCNNGASNSENAGYFCGCIEQLTNKILRQGGYAE